MSIPTAAQITALVAPVQTWDFRYELLDNGNRFIDTVDVASCTVSNNDLATQVKRTCTVEMASDAITNQLLHRFRPYARLLLSTGVYTEWPMGTFILSTDSTEHAADPGTLRTFEGYDLLLVLHEDKVIDRYVVAAGANYVTTIRTVLTSAGFDSSTIPSLGATLQAAMEWEPGTSKLDIVNELLVAINYTTLSVDPMGVPVAYRYVSPDNAPAIWSYAIDEQSVILPGITSSLDLFNVPNVWVGIVSTPDRTAYRSVLTNSDPGSPLSTVSRGRNVVRILTDEVKDAPDQAALDALVARYRTEASQLYEEATFTTGLMPFHESGDAAILDYGDGEAAYREHSWKMTLKAGGTHDHVFRRAVTL